MKRSLAALVAAGIAALSLATGTAAASAAPNAAQATATPQKSFTFVIDQLATRGPNGPDDQYIQIRNLSQVPQDLSNFKVELALSPSQIITLATILPGTVLQPGQVYVIANPAGFSDPVVDQYLTSFIPIPDLFGIGLLSSSDVVVDAVATDAASPFVRGTPLPPTDQPLALVRLTYTDNNAVDFHIASRTPGLPGPVTLF